MSEKFAGADWLEQSLGIKASPFGRKVADILGQVWRGIYGAILFGTSARPTARTPRARTLMAEL